MLQVPLLCKILRSLLVNTYSEQTHEHDVGGVTDPFLQVKASHTSFPTPQLSCYLLSGSRTSLETVPDSVTRELWVHAGK